MRHFKLVIILCLLAVITSISSIVVLKNNNGKNTNSQNNDVSDEYVYSDEIDEEDSVDITLGGTGGDLVRIKKFYYGTKEVMIDGELEKKSTTLILLDNGYFNIIYNGPAPYGYLGTYEIKNNGIILNCIYSNGSGAGVEDAKDVIKYKILNNNEIKNDNESYKLNKELSHEGLFMNDEYSVFTTVLDDAWKLYDMGYYVEYHNKNQEYIFDGGINEIYIKLNGN